MNLKGAISHRYLQTPFLAGNIYLILNFFSLFDVFFSYFLSPNLDFFQSDSVLLPYNLELFSAKIMEALELFRCLCFKTVFALNFATE